MYPRYDNQVFHNWEKILYGSLWASYDVYTHQPKNTTSPSKWVMYAELKVVGLHMNVLSKVLKFYYRKRTHGCHLIRVKLYCNHWLMVKLYCGTFTDLSHTDKSPCYCNVVPNKNRKNIHFSIRAERSDIWTGYCEGLIITARWHPQRLTSIKSIVERPSPVLMIYSQPLPVHYHTYL